jgi:hypothetical protein
MIFEEYTVVVESVASKPASFKNRRAWHPEIQLRSFGSVEGWATRPAERHFATSFRPGGRP